MDNDEKQELKKHLIQAIKDSECISNAMAICVSDVSHAFFYKNGFHRDKDVVSAIDSNRKKAEKDMIKHIVNVVEVFRLFHAAEIASFIRVHYNTYKEKYAAHPDVKAAINQAKLGIKAEIRNNFLENKTPTAQIALYKLIGSKEEVDRLNGSTKSIDLTSGGKPIIQPIIISMSDEEE